MNFREDNLTAKEAMALQSAVERRAMRRRVLKKGIVRYGDRQFCREVVVRDISNTGALVRCRDNELIPDRFHLIIDTDGLSAECEVIHRSGNDIGCRFVLQAERMSPLDAH